MRKNNNMVLYILIFIILLVAMSRCAVPVKANIDKMIKEDSHFQYSTSLTSEFERTERANVYETDMTVTEAVDYIRSKSKSTDVQFSDDKTSAALLYDDYYVFVYEGENNKTYVQVSTRQYAYHGGTQLYRSRHYGAFDFFRDYYVIKALTRDYNRYQGPSYYDTYRPTTVPKTTTPKATTPKTTTPKATTPSTPSKIQRSNTFKIKRSSIGSRPSIGGGTSFGK